RVTGRYDRESHGISDRGEFCRIVAEAAIAARADEVRLREHSERAWVGRDLTRAREIHGKASALASFFHIQAGIRCDRIQPAAQRGSVLEFSLVLPCARECFLHRVFRLGIAAKESVAVSD